MKVREEKYEEDMEDPKLDFLSLHLSESYESQVKVENLEDFGNDTTNLVDIVKRWEPD